jgi:hypothetical protein
MMLPLAAWLMVVVAAKMASIAEVDSIVCLVFRV